MATSPFEMVGKVGLCRIKTHKARVVKFCPSSGVLSGAMKTQPFILLGLAAVGSTACSRTTLDNAATVPCQLTVE
jgi:hypothetical protein